LTKNRKYPIEIQVYRNHNLFPSETAEAEKKKAVPKTAEKPKETKEKKTISIEDKIDKFIADNKLKSGNI
jgi:hypothetical protein